METAAQLGTTEDEQMAMGRVIDEVDRLDAEDWVTFCHALRTGLSETVVSWPATPEGSDHAGTLYKREWEGHVMYYVVRYDVKEPHSHGRYLYREKRDADEVAAQLREDTGIPYEVRTLAFPRIERPEP